MSAGGRIAGTVVCFSHAYAVNSCSCSCSCSKTCNKQRSIATTREVIRRGFDYDYDYDYEHEHEHDRTVLSNAYKV